MACHKQHQGAKILKAKIIFYAVVFLYTFPLSKTENTFTELQLNKLNDNRLEWWFETLPLLW